MFPPALVPESVAAVSRLLEAAPDPCDSRCQSELFPAVGTHYTASGTVGVTAEILLSVNATWVQANGWAAASQNVLLVVKAIGWLLGLTVGYDESFNWKSVSESFLANAEIQLFFNGEPIPWQDKSPAWLEEQVLSDPQLARRRLRPITDLCTSDAQRANLEQALDEYLYGPGVVRAPRRARASALPAQPIASPAGPAEAGWRRAEGPARSGLASPDDCGLLPWWMHPQLPGVEWLAGFDSPTAMPTLPVMQLTYTEPVSCYRPPDAPDKIYKVPDQVYVMAAPTACNCVGYNVMSSVSEWISVRYSDITKHSGMFGLDVVSTQTLDAAGQLIAHRSLLMWNASCETVYQAIAAMTPLDIHPIFRSSVDALPASWSPDNTTREWQLYDQFLGAYGPAYLRAVSLGGTAIVQVALDSCFLAQGGAEFVAQESFQTFLGLINDLSGSAGGHAGLAAFWDAYASVSTQLSGNFLRFKFQNLSQWQEALMDNLGVVSFELEPVASLVFWDPLRASNLALAAQDYLERAVARSDAYQSQLQPKTPPAPPPWCTGQPAPPAARGWPGEPDPPHRRPPRPHLATAAEPAPG
jgi:MAC/Perforin domain